MKKACCIPIVCVMMFMVMVGCGSEKGPSGTYTPGDGLVFITFDGNKSTELHMGQLTASGTWKIKMVLLLLRMITTQERRSTSTSRE